MRVIGVESRGEPRRGDHLEGHVELMQDAVCGVADGRLDRLLGDDAEVGGAVLLHVHRAREVCVVCLLER